MADLTITNDDPYRLARRDDAPPVAGPLPPPATPPAPTGAGATRDTAERWRPRAGVCAPLTDRGVPRSPETLVAAMKRSATSVMVRPAPRSEDMRHGAVTAGVHVAMEAAARVLEKLGRHAAGQTLSTAAPVMTFVEAGVHVLEQNQRGAITSQRRAAAQGFANTVAAALDRGTRCVDPARTDPWVVERGGLSAARRERDFYTWGATAGAKFIATLSPRERESLVRAIGAMAPAGCPSHDNKFELSVRVQRHVLGAEWSRP